MKNYPSLDAALQHECVTLQELRGNNQYLRIHKAGSSEGVAAAIDAKLDINMVKISQISKQIDADRADAHNVKSLKIIPFVLRRFVGVAILVVAIALYRASIIAIDWAAVWFVVKLLLQIALFIGAVWVLSWCFDGRLKRKPKDDTEI